MKKILIIQTDPTYFLEETLRTIESYKDYFANSDINLLVDKAAYNEISKFYQPFIKNLYTEENSLTGTSFEISFNLSLNEKSWETHRNINSLNKVGPYLNSNNNLIINESWSTYYLIQNFSKTPLTFHLRDIFRNILGFKNGVDKKIDSYKRYSTIVFGKTFSHNENEFYANLKNFLINQNSGFKFKQLDEVDFIQDFTESIYIGPPCLEALRLNDLGARSILISTHFEGTNLIPYENKNFLINLKSSKVKFSLLCEAISNIIHERPLVRNQDFAVYETSLENLFGVQLKSIFNPDIKFMCYQINLVLWNYILNLCEVNLSIHQFNHEEIQYIKETKKLIDKTQRIIEIAIKCCETIFHHSKKEFIDFQFIQNYINQIGEVENCLEATAKSNFFISQILDFYKIKRSFETDPLLSHQAQTTLINFIEEKHVLSAYTELIDLIIKKNDQALKI